MRLSPGTLRDPLLIVRYLLILHYLLILCYLLILNCAIAISCIVTRFCAITHPALPFTQRCHSFTALSLILCTFSHLALSSFFALSLLLLISCTIALLALSLGTISHCICFRSFVACAFAPSLKFPLLLCYHSFKLLPSILKSLNKLVIVLPVCSVQNNNK